MWTYNRVFSSVSCILTSCGNQILVARLVFPVNCSVCGMCLIDGKQFKKVKVTPVVFFQKFNETLRNLGSY